MNKILVIDDEEKIAKLLKKYFQSLKYEIEYVLSAKEAFAFLEKNHVDIVISDLNLPKISGLEILKIVKKKYPWILFLIITGYGTIDKAISATKNGVDAFIKKPFELEEIEFQIQKLLKTRNMETELNALKEKKIDESSIDKIIGISDEIKRIKKQILDVAGFNTSVLLTGESGTGKEVVAKALHYNSPRRTRPFYAVNCSAIPEQLLESELFGHTKGAFTGAYTDKIGLMKEASGSTLFLDEIGDLPMVMQVKLLRALQERKIMPVGSSKEIDVDFRLISATSKNLQEEITKNRFREDLFYRINVIEIDVPPLRMRQEDIPVLLKHFIKENSIKLDIPEKELSDEALDVILSYSFPGNVRELENIAERLMILCKGNKVKKEDVEKIFYKSKNHFEVSITDFSLPYKDAFKKVQDLFDKQYIQFALKKNAYNKQKTAEYLGISSRLLYYKMRNLF